MLLLLNLPFGRVDGVVMVLATSGLLTSGSMVGFMTLFGITGRNSIVMTSHYQHLVTVEGAPWSEETAVRREIERAMASVILGGVVGMRVTISPMTRFVVMKRSLSRRPR